MQKSAVDLFLESEPLIPSDAKTVQTPVVPNNSGVSFQKTDPKELLGASLALVAPYATPDWDKPIKREDAAKKQEDPALAQIFGESQKVDRTLAGLRLRSVDPESSSTPKIRESMEIKPPSFVMQMEQSGHFREEIGPLARMAGIVEPKVQESVASVSTGLKPSLTKEAIQESILSGSMAPEPVTVDPKLAAAKTASAFRNFL